MHTQIFKTIAGSRLYGTSNADSDTDYKAVHLPTKSDLLLGRGKDVVNTSTGSSYSHNGADDVDVESFRLQRFLKLASDMQTIPVEMLFVPSLTTFLSTPAEFLGTNPRFTAAGTFLWNEIVSNRDKILSRNTQSFVGYCKGQAVRYSMRGKRLDTYIQVCEALSAKHGMKVKVWTITETLASINGVQIIPKEQPGGAVVDYLDVYGRQVPMTLTCEEALKVYQKPVDESGERARKAQQSGGMDQKALYHAVRIADEGISLFGSGVIEFPYQNVDFLLKIRAGELEIDHILDVFDEKMAILEGIGEKSPLAETPDYEWIDGFVSSVHEDIVRGRL